ncbi:hypothetical protein [Streptomyces avicenniae]|uniref:hypothetical protein n=1 Tax=Streptomyces avicenniae TaxID=500153 RepID=UPI00069A3807|nr:hypothetical protein [Streptomyces avicenniae]
MTTTVSFDTPVAAEALLRAAVLFKFDGGSDAEPYVGSPPYAHAVRRLLAAVADGHRAAGREGTARRWLDLYRLGGHDERLLFVREFARRHPDWDTLDDAARRAWVETVAAPYTVSDDDLARVSA